jgi:hypothetical protein
MFPFIPLCEILSFILSFSLQQLRWHKMCKTTVSILKKLMSNK